MKNDLSFRVFNSVQFGKGGYSITSGQVAVGSGGLTFDGTGDVLIQSSVQLRNTANSNPFINVAVPTSRLTISGVVGNFTGTTIDKTGSGALRYSGGNANAFKGTTRVLAGNLELAKSTRGLNAINGPLEVNGAGQVLLLQSEQINGSVKLNSGARLELGSQEETIGLLSLGNNSLVTGTAASRLILSQDVEIQVGQPNAISQILVGKVKLGRSGTNPFTEFRIPGLGGSSSTLFINAAIEGRALRQSGGVLIMAGATPNTYTGETAVIGGELRLDKADGVIAVPANLTINRTGGGFSQVTLNSAGQVSQFSNLTMTGVAILELNGHRFEQTHGSSASSPVTTVTMTGGTIRSTGSNATFEMPADLKVLASATPSRIETFASFQRVASSTSPGPFRFHTIDIASGATVVIDNPSRQFVTVNPVSQIDVTGLGTLEWTQRSGVLFDGKVNVKNSRVLIHNQVSDRGPLFLSNGVIVETDPFANLNIQSADASLVPVLSPGNSTTPVTTVTMKDPYFGVHRLDLNGTGADQFDREVIFNPTPDPNGRVFLAGTLDLRVNFASVVGNSFDIMTLTTSAPVDTGFRNIDGNVITPGTAFQAGGRSFKLEVVSPQASQRIVRVTHINSGPAFQDRTLTRQILEGQEAVLTGRITEPDAGDTFLLDVDWGDGTFEQIVVPPDSDPLLTLRHRYVQDGRYNVNLAWRDQHGTSLRTAVESLTVLNVPPTFTTVSAPASIPLGTTYQLIGALLDPGTADALDLKIDWGDGSPVEAVPVSSSQTFSASHDFARTGTFVVKLTLSDNSSKPVKKTLRVRVTAP